MIFKQGDTVYVKGHDESARITDILEGIEGGVRLDRPLEGFRYWNVAELMRALGSTTAKREMNPR